MLYTGVYTYNIMYCTLAYAVTHIIMLYTVSTYCCFIGHLPDFLSLAELFNLQKVG